MSSVVGAPFFGLSRRAASPQKLKIARQTQRAAPQQLQIECPEPRIGSALHVFWPWRERLEDRVVSHDIAEFAASASDIDDARIGRKMSEKKTAHLAVAI